MQKKQETSHQELPKPSESSRQDRELIDQIKRGDDKPYQVLVEKYQRALYFHINKMVREKEMIEDLVQETFVKAFDNLYSFDTRYAFSTWLYRIATNHTIDYLRKKKLQTLSLDEPYQTKDGELTLEVADESNLSDAGIEQKQRANIISAAIDRLPDKYRVIIRLRHMEEKSYQEISELLDLPIGTVKAHIFRAREMLYKQLKDRRPNF